MPTQTMTRRDALQAGAIASALLAGGHLPLLAAPARPGKRRPAAAGAQPPPAVEPITGYLDTYRSPAAAKPGDGYKLRYDVIQWTGTQAPAGKTRNRVIGTLDLARAAGSDGPTFTVARSIAYGRERNILQAEIRCAGDDLVGLRSWTVRTRTATPGGRPAQNLRMTETGRVAGGKISIANGDYKYGFGAKGPVASQWTLLDALMRPRGDSFTASFDLLQDLSLFKPGQTLRAAGPVAVPTAGGKITLAGFLQLGPGILPTHYLVDDRGLVQLVTVSMLSWALKSAARA